MSTCFKTDFSNCLNLEEIELIFILNLAYFSDCSPYSQNCSQNYLYQYLYPGPQNVCHCKLPHFKIIFVPSSVKWTPF